MRLMGTTYFSTESKAYEVAILKRVYIFCMPSLSLLCCSSSYGPSSLDKIKSLGSWPIGLHSLLHLHRFENAIHYFTQSGIDPRAVISLVPEILPSELDRRLMSFRKAKVCTLREYTCLKLQILNLDVSSKA